MSIYKGSSKQGTIYVGGTKIGKVYKGSTLVYQNGFKLLGTTLNQYDSARRFYLLKEWNANSLIFVDELTIPNTIQSIQGTLGAAGSKITVNVGWAQTFTFLETITVSGLQFHIYYQYDSDYYSEYIVYTGSQVGDKIYYTGKQWTDEIRYPSSLTENSFTHKYMWDDYTATRNAARDIDLNYKS